VRWVRVSTDAAVAAKEILARRMTIRDYRESLRGPLEHATLCRDDPLPGLADAPLLLAGRLVRRLGAGDGRRGAGRTPRS
jgi:predicted ATP-grasp superfamily ATP-dependent carboligase